MAANVELTLKRGKQLEDLNDKARDLADKAGDFRDGAKRVRSKMCWQKWRMYILVALVIAALLGLVIWWMAK